MTMTLGYVRRVGLIGLLVCTLGGLCESLPLVQSMGSVPLGDRYPSQVIMAGLISLGIGEQPSAIDRGSLRHVFDMETVPVTGALARKWWAIELKIDEQRRVVASCRAHQSCPEPAQSFLNIVAAAAGRTGRARIGLINRAVNLKIAPVADEWQWGVDDHWSSPFETLQTHRGDCEDYAILKYVALREAGVSGEDLKILILRNLFPNEDHAVVAVRLNGEWLILDNRRLALVRDTDVTRATPRFLLDESGVHRFVPTGQPVPGSNV